MVLFKALLATLKSTQPAGLGNKERESTIVRESEYCIKGNMLANF